MPSRRGPTGRSRTTSSRRRTRPAAIPSTCTASTRAPRIWIRRTWTPRSGRGHCCWCRGSSPLRKPERSWRSKRTRRVSRRTSSSATRTRVSTSRDRRCGRSSRRLPWSRLYAPAWTALGAVKFLGGQRGDAAPAFQKAVELAPHSIDARLALANFQWASGQMAEAESTLRAALDIDSRNAAAHRVLALLYLSTDRAPSAEPHFKALATEPGGKLALADYYMGLRRSADALALVDDLEKSTDQAQVQSARLRRAALAYGSGRKPEAHQILDALIEAKPRNAEARVAKARMLLADGKAADALEQAREAVKADSTLPSAHYTAGLAALAADKPDVAEKAFEEVVRLSPRAAGAQLQLSRLRLARGQAADALTAARDAAYQRPDSPEAAILVARSLRAQGDAAKAWSELSASVARHPDSAPLHIERGWVALDRKDSRGRTQRLRGGPAPGARLNRRAVRAGRDPSGCRRRDQRARPGGGVARRGAGQPQPRCTRGARGAHGGQCGRCRANPPIGRRRRRLAARRVRPPRAPVCLAGKTRSGDRTIRNDRAASAPADGTANPGGHAARDARRPATREAGIRSDRGGRRCAPALRPTTLPGSTRRKGGWTKRCGSPGSRRNSCGPVPKQRTRLAGFNCAEA